MLKMETERERVVKKFRVISDRYHKLSLLFNELAGSLNIELKPFEHSRKKIKEHLKGLGLSYDKLVTLTKGIEQISLSDIQETK